MSIEQLQTGKSTTNPTDESTQNTDFILCTQIGFGNKGPIRSAKLQRISEPIPEGAVTASPVYALSPAQFEQQKQNDEPKVMAGKFELLASELQEECEDDDRVLHPIHIESDEYLSEGPETLIEWLREFVEEYLDVRFHSCTLYFSGRRSIHVHVPRFVLGTAGRERLKELAKTYCRESGADLDLGLYSRKRIFRLPGVKHQKTGLWKAEIQPEWDHERIIRESSTFTPDDTTPYDAILQNIFETPLSLGLNGVSTPTGTFEELIQTLNDQELILEPGKPESGIETPLIERKEYPEKTADVPRWAQYRTRMFSPYTYSKNGSRSVAVVKIKGTPFAREDITIGDRNTPVHALIPSYFYGARGCTGGEFTKENQHAPLQLSKTDYDKWDYEVGDNVVIIGGQSRSSIIKKVTSWQATVVGHALTGEGASRQAAFEYLESEGIDTGSAGASQSSSRSGNSSTSRSRSSTTSSTSMPETEAARLQRIAEEDGIHLLGHEDVANVANRLLEIDGWSLAWNWCEEQYGDQFKPDKTRKHLIGIIEYYGDHDVTIPPK